MIIERQKFSIQLCTNGITEILLKDTCTIELDDSLEIEAILKNEQKENGHLLLIISGATTSVSNESRDYSIENPLQAKALAIMAKSLPQKIAANFIMVAYRKKLPNYPTKMFMRKEKAIEWLLKK